MKKVSISWRRYLLPPLHEEGPKFIVIFGVISLVIGCLWHPLGWVGLAATLWCYSFFRDPVRYVPSREGLVVTPASGIVQMVGLAVPPPELGLGSEPRPRVCVFMSVFDCHVNRIPVAGKVTHVVYRPGKFFDASLDKASEDNERNGLRIELDDGRDLGVVQIAGLVARRIRCDAREGQLFKTGERFGLIRFGSRVDVYLPIGTHPLVVCGQNALSGETILADLASAEPERDGTVI